MSLNYIKTHTSHRDEIIITISSDENHVTDQAIEKLADKCRYLRKLCLNNYRKLTDVSIVKIADSCPNLQYLSLSFIPKITDTSVFRIANGCLKLEYISLENNRNITYRSIAHLGKKCLSLCYLQINKCAQFNDCGADSSTMQMIYYLLRRNQRVEIYIHDKFYNDWIWGDKAYFTVEQVLFEKKICE
jgi:hypothetical protein